MKTYQPVIKWFGSKRPVAAELSQYVLEAPRYYEPFVGGGAMMPNQKLDLQVTLFLSSLNYGI